MCLSSGGIRCFFLCLSFFFSFSLFFLDPVHIWEMVFFFLDNSGSEVACMYVCTYGRSLTSTRFIKEKSMKIK